MSRYKYAFYDLDGTLGDTCEGIFNCAANAMKILGVEFDGGYESMRRLVGPPLVYAFKNYFGMGEKEALRATELYRERYKDIGIFEMKLYDGVIDSVKRLADNGIVLVVVSAKPTEYVERIVKRFELDKYFELCVGANMTDKDTSKTHLIKQAIEYYNITDFSSVVMIGDRKYDLESANEVGIDSIGVSYGYGELEEIQAYSPVYIADNPVKICEYILGEE